MLKPYFSEPKDRDFLNRYFFSEYVDNLRQHIPAPRAAKGVKSGVLRVASYNIHYHTKYTEVDTRTKEEYNADIKSSIKELDPDFLVIQEAQKPETVLPEGAFPYVRYYEAENKYWPMGNAICSKYPLLDVRCVTFEQDESLMKTEPRCYLAATIEPKKGKRIRVIGTHLDVTDNSDETRYQQLEQLDAEAKLSAMENVCIVGDLNAMYRPDYDDNHWKFIEATEKNRDVEPVTKAMHRIIEDLSWRDAHRESRLVQGRERKTVRRDFNVSTWALRRIDYALLSPKFKYKVDDSMVLYDSSSDHVPIAIDVKL